MIETYVTTVCSGVVGLFCIVLVFHKQYEDGLIGRLSLAILSLAAFSRGVNGMEAIWLHKDMHVSPQAFATWVALAMFFSRHVYRFMMYKGRHLEERGVK